MGLNWNEIKSRALLFSKTWDDACNENSQAKPFWIDFFEIFGITNKRVATFELNVKKLGGAQGFVDLFWPGMLLVEHKSLGKNLDDAVDQAVGYPLSKKWIRQILSGEDFINGKSRQCLWLATAAPAELRQCTGVMHRVEKVKNFRKQSNRLATQKLADTPTLFGEVRQPQSKYLFVPKTSSERREYVPIGFVSSDVIINNTSLFVDQATPFHFGILSSTMHNAWMRATCGRLESRFRYSSSVVYNNYPWPGFAGEPLSDKHRTAIEQAAQCVLDARAQFASSSLADLYDPLTMPPALLKAHQKLDTAVDAAYQPSGGKKSYASDAERVAFLFELYQRITSLVPAPTAKKTRKTKATES